MKKIFSSTLFALLSFFAAFSQSASTFINEINYLASNPVNRGFEIAGEAGSSVDGWQTAMYNANGTVGTIEDLGNSVIPNQQNGYGSIWYDVSQSSNGGGVALMDPNGNVTQFLSYGGSLFNNLVITATNGPAAGLTSTFIGKQLLGISSLQLTGIGTEYTDFIWGLPLGITPAGINLNQLFSFLPPLAYGNTSQDDGFAEMEPSTEFKVLQTPGTPFQEVVAFPNPVVDRLQIRFATELPQGIRLELYDRSGRLLESREVSEHSISAEFDLSEVPPGEYVLKTIGGASQLIVKQ